MSFEHHVLTAADGSTLQAYDVGTDTLVLHVHDVSSLTDGPHDARIELPLAKLRELFAFGFSGPSTVTRVAQLANKIQLTRTCLACPEQYDAHLDGELVGYLRLRHGHFTVRVPDSDGEVVYSADTKGDGAFDDSERNHLLHRARVAIAESRLVP